MTKGLKGAVLKWELNERSRRTEKESVDDQDASLNEDHRLNRKLPHSVQTVKEKKLLNAIKVSMSFPYLESNYYKLKNTADFKIINVEHNLRNACAILHARLNTFS